MQLFDLHNDALLELPQKDLAGYLKRQDHGTKILLSVWTTELTDPMKVICERAALIKNRPNCLLHIEDAWFLTPENIDGFIALHPVTVGLSWNGKNALCGGALSAGGITKWGYTVIEKLERAGIQIDTAHLNRKSFWQFAKATKRPIFCSHTCFNAVNAHPRNLTDNQVKKIITANG
jgi:microsomal dipeptidase-like Zn-dependent dipeptidase